MICLKLNFKMKIWQFAVFQYRFNSPQVKQDLVFSILQLAFVGIIGNILGNIKKIAIFLGQTFRPEWYIALLPVSMDV